MTCRELEFPKKQTSWNREALDQWQTLCGDSPASFTTGRKKKRSIKRQENSARTDFTVTGARAGILEPSPDNITLAIFKHSTILENSDNK